MKNGKCVIVFDENLPFGIFLIFASHGRLELIALIPESQGFLHYCPVFPPQVQLDFIYCTEMKIPLK
ncbi:MAG: hypothetical protein HFH68_13120 [Lachnospiraceae bacterium]|nr:hypothetical protein [Lachnospiraceae bacterium]